MHLQYTMKTEFHSPGEGATLSYRAPEVEAVELGPQYFLCASSRNGGFEDWTHDSGGYNNGDFD